MAAFDKKDTKLIKVNDRGMIYTSRGMVRGPITVPYLEKFDAILLMVTRFNHDVVEVLKDGSEVKLTVHNFNLDNNAPAEKIPTMPVRKEEPDKELNPTQAINAGMSRKERKRLEYERHQAELAKKQEEDAAAQQTDTKDDKSAESESDKVAESVETLSEDSGNDTSANTNN